MAAIAGNNVLAVPLEDAVGKTSWLTKNGLNLWRSLKNERIAVLTSGGDALE